VAANAEFLVQSYPGPRPASMVSASLGLGCRSATEGGGEGAAEEVKLGEDRLEEGETVGNGESFQPPPDISDLPFSMPKLARRLGQAPSSPPLKLFRQPASQSLSLNISPPDLGSCVSQPCSPTFPGAKPLKSRPMSLVQPNNQAGPQLNLPLHSRPGLLPLAGSATGPFGRPDSSVDPLAASAMLTDNAAGLFGGSAPASAVPTRKKPLLFLAPSSLSLAACKEVDTTLPLESQEWYHGMLSRVQAETVLRPHSEGSYLVRQVFPTSSSQHSTHPEASGKSVRQVATSSQESGSADGRNFSRGNQDLGRMDYSLAIKSSRGFMHLRIQREHCGSSYRLAEFDKKFPSVVAMVHHYSINRLPIRGAEHMCLLTPVTEELL